MRAAFSFFPEILWAVVAGAAMAMTVIPFNAMAFVIWLGVLFVRVYKSETRPAWDASYALRSRGSVRRGSLLQCGVLILVLVAAATAPVKITQELMSRTIHLNSRKMSLQELDEYVSSDEFKNKILRQTRISFADEDRRKIVEWPSREVTLRDLLAAIESQTTLKHKFYHCGNGSTLLWGGDCYFGLSIYAPRPGDRKMYDRYQAAE